MTKRNNPIAWLFLAPAILFFCTFMFYPMGRSIFLSLTKYNFLSSPQFVGVENFIRLFQDPNFLRALSQTFQISIVVIIANVVFPLLLAVVVNQKIKGINFFRACYYIPVVTSMVVVGIVWKGLYNESGILNHLLLSFHLIGKPISWLDTPQTALLSVAIVIIWRGLGYYMVIYLAGLQAISKELYEASEIDGARRFRQFVAITVPLLKPSILIVSVMTTINAFKIFDEVYIMTGGGPVRSTETIVYFIYDAAFSKLRVGYASAAGVVLFVLCLVFALINMRVNRRGLS